MAFPGILTRSELATGLNTKSICVNGNYLVVEQCNINQEQEHGVNNYIQGGPAYAIYNLGAKKHVGSFSFPLRVDQDGNLEEAAKIILRYAAKPMTSLKIDTHNVLSSFTTKKLVLIDTFNNPVEVDRKELLSKLKEIYISVTQEWYKEWKELEAKR